MSDATEPTPVTVRLLDKEYLIACPAEERAALEQAAQHLHGRMREIRDSGKIVGLDRIAVLAALNLSAELLKNQGKDRKSEGDLGGRVKALRERIDAALERSRQTSL